MPLRIPDAQQFPRPPPHLLHRHRHHSHQDQLGQSHRHPHHLHPDHTKRNEAKTEGINNQSTKSKISAIQQRRQKKLINVK